MLKKNIKLIFEESISLKTKCLNQGLDVISLIGDEACKTIQNKGKIMFCGNGGSASDAQHLVAEMLIRLRPTKNREGIAAISLAQDTSTITACGNDYGFDTLYERTLRSLGKKEDCFIGISTSGNSKNVINAIKKAKEKSMITIGFLGKNKTIMNDYCDITINIPSDDTARVQESHIKLGHIICQIVEDKLF